MITKNDILDAYGKNIFYIENTTPEAFLKLCGKKIGINTGDYGRNWTAFDVGHEICIVEGNRNLFGEPLPEELTEKFEKRALKLFKDLNYLSRQKKGFSLALDFVEKLKK